MFDDSMFADCLLITSGAQKARRGWTTLTSFGLQAVLMSLLLLIPILRTVGLPLARTVSTPITMSKAAPEPVERAHVVSTVAPQSNFQGIHLIAPGRIPTIVSRTADEVAPVPPGEVIGIQGIGSDDRTGPPLAVPSGNNAVPFPAPPKPSVKPLRISTMSEGMIVRKVQPVYPNMAKIAHVQGVVELDAVISKEGTIEKLQLISGHPMLAGAAIEAVRQWRYRPYVLNGEPIEVETRITVNFTLAN